MRKMIKRLATGFLSFLLVSSLVLPGIPVHTAAATDPVIVVSLGDSYSAGEGIEKFYGQDKPVREKVLDDDWLAHRSTKSWPSLLKVGNSQTMGNYKVALGTSSTADYQWYFAAASGAETIHIQNPFNKWYDQDVDGEFWDVRGDRDLPPQIEAFDNINGEVDYVTMTLGGNDVDFAGVVTKCVVNCSYLHLGSTSALEDLLQEKWDNFDTTRTNIKQAYQDVAAKAPNASIIIAGYPKLLDKDGRGKVINKGEATLVNSAVTEFNSRLKGIVAECQAAGMDIHFVDVESEFDKDGGHMAYSPDPWINGVMTPQAEDIDHDMDLNSFASSYSIHPNAAGARAYAKCVNAKIEELQNRGTISGKIVKASDEETPVTNATIFITGDKAFATLTPNSLGQYSAVLPEGEYRIRINAPGYIEFDAYVTVKPGENKYMETLLLVDGDESDTGTSMGVISNALTGSGVEGVTLDVRRGWNNSEVGDVITTVTTNSTGLYMVTLPIGNYTLTATKDGYISTTLNIIVKKDGQYVKHGAISPIITGSDYRIVLSWGANPRDLDSHVQGKLANGSEFHVAYYSKSAYDDGVEICNLDLDDTSGYGPETITLKANQSTPYYYYIHHYSGSGTICSSSAQIKVFQGSTHVATFNVPTNLGDGIFWNVFAIVNGELQIKNTITTIPDVSYATPASRMRFMSAAPLDPVAEILANPKIVTPEDTVSEETPPVDTTSPEEISVPETGETEPVAFKKIYFQADPAYTWFIQAQNMVYDAVAVADGLYSVDIPENVMNIILLAVDEDGTEVYSEELSLADIPEGNCIVVLSVDGTYEITWGTYNPITGTVTVIIPEAPASEEPEAGENADEEPPQEPEAGENADVESVQESETEAFSEEASDDAESQEA